MPTACALATYSATGFSFGLSRWLNQATLMPRWAHFSRSYMLGTQQAMVKTSLSKPGDSTAPAMSSLPVYFLNDEGSGGAAEAERPRASNSTAEIVRRFIMT